MIVFSTDDCGIVEVLKTPVVLTGAGSSISELELIRVAIGGDSKMSDIHPEEEISNP